MIDEQLVAVCKMRKGEDVADGGYVYVSLSIVYMHVGVPERLSTSNDENLEYNVFLLWKCNIFYHSFYFHLCQLDFTIIYPQVMREVENDKETCKNFESTSVTNLYAL